MRRFYLYKRSKKSKVFYAQIVNPNTGERMPGRSTGTTDRDEATFIAMGWIKNGFPVRDEVKDKETVFAVDEILYKLKKTEIDRDDAERIIAILKEKRFLYVKSNNTAADREQGLIEYLTDFWDYKNSQYIKYKNNHRRKKISKAYVLNMSRNVSKFWKPYFGELSLFDLTNEALENFGSHLISLKKTDQKGKELKDYLSTQTISHILKAGSTALNFAKQKKIIMNNPAESLKPFIGKEKQSRGILTDKEVQKLFSKGDWAGNPGNMLGNLLAMQTGIRLGEMQGLKYQDIGEDRLFIKHSWNDLEGLKGTKTGKERTVPLLKETREMLIEYAEKNPHGYSQDSFIFWSINSADKPQGKRSFSTSLNRAVDSIGVNRKDRNIVFHSWRHYYARKMSLVLSKETMKLTGHSTESVFENYSNHEDEKQFQKAIAATGEVFGKILEFKKEAM